MKNNVAKTILLESMKRTVSPTPGETFGQRMARYRKARGFSQADLAETTGISSRVIAYYEAQTKHPPTNYLPVIAKALKISIDELMGFKLTKEDLKPKSPKLWRRLRKIDQLPPKEQKILIHYLDTLFKHSEVENNP